MKRLLYDHKILLHDHKRLLRDHKSSLDLITAIPSKKTNKAPCQTPGLYDPPTLQKGVRIELP